MKFQEGDRVSTKHDPTSPARVLSKNHLAGTYRLRWDRDGSGGDWHEDALRWYAGDDKDLKQLSCDYPPVSWEVPVKEEEDPMKPIVDMLLLTNLAHRLGIPEPCSVEMSWDDPQYLLWILWRADAIAPR
jgi:hypothetical protein